MTLLLRLTYHDDIRLEHDGATAFWQWRSWENAAVVRVKCFF